MSRKYIDIGILIGGAAVILWQWNRIQYWINLPIKYLTDRLNSDYIADLHPKYKATFAAFIKDIEQLGYDVTITSGYRSFQRSAELNKENPLNADAGLSTHNYGLAVDIILYKDNKWWRKATSKADWIKTGVPELAKKHGLFWGGDFKNYHDPVHFNVMGIDTEKLLAKYNKDKTLEPNKISLT